MVKHVDLKSFPYRVYMLFWNGSIPATKHGDEMQQVYFSFGDLQWFHSDAFLLPCGLSSLHIWLIFNEYVGIQPSMGG
ncbi:hypothetical protein DM860_003981 [Cuscuta australis]|uniref:Uncharacterized protein n=1 Tax=Cuscuta australis TaxID=267555 RepID=A0A328CYE3_9ASTE|nr:hypothetical protein DM860_003981 [Cuscuta australis]